MKKRGHADLAKKLRMTPRLRAMAEEVAAAAREGRPVDPANIPPPPLGQLRRAPKQYLHPPFILPRRLLDRTQPADLGYTGTRGARERWMRDHPGARPEDAPRQFWVPPYPDCPVSHSQNLELFVLGHKVLANTINGETRRDALVIPEIGQGWTWRCRHVGEDGHRCLFYCRHGFLCTFHDHYWRKSALMNAMKYDIPDHSLAAIVEKHRNDPNIRSIENEVSIMRSMLSLLLKQVNLHKSEDLDPAHMNAIMQTSKMITDAAEKMTAIESKLTAKMSIEQLNAIASGMFTAVVEVCELTPEQSHTLASRWAKIINPTRSVMVDAETGELVDGKAELRNFLADPDASVAPEDRQIMTGGRTAYSPTLGRLPEPKERPTLPDRCPQHIKVRLSDMAVDPARWGHV